MAALSLLARLNRQASDNGGSLRVFVCVRLGPRAPGVISTPLCSRFVKLLLRSALLTTASCFERISSGDRVN